MPLQRIGLNLRRLYESSGESFEVMKERLHDLMDAEQCKAENVKPIKCEDFSLLELYDFCESVDVTQFPTLTGLLLEKKVMEAYEAAALIGDQLVTPMQSSQQISRVPGAFVLGNMHDIEPGMPYEHDGDVEEKWVQIEGKKRGAILDVTWEAVKFDQTGLVLNRAARFGNRAAIDREQRILWTIMDITVAGVNYWAWYPSVAGVITRTALWSAAVAGGAHPQSNLIAHALQNWTDLDAAQLQLALMQDDNGDPILNDPKILLVPKSLDTTAKRLINNSMLPAMRHQAAGDSPNEANPFANRFTVLSSALFDAQSTTEWYLGDFKKQFIEKIVIPLQVLTRPMANTDDEFERDIVAQYKVRHYTQVGAVDYRFCVKSLGTYGVCPSESYCSTWAA